MSRVVPFRAKAPTLVRQRIDETLATTMYLVQTIGPTSFVVQEQNSERKHKVLVGPLQTCSCGDADVCIHVLFVMLKVFRVPATNPTVWQKSLIDSEVDALLRGDYREKVRVPVQKKNGTAFLKKHSKEAPSAEPQTDSEESDAQRHELAPGEVCAICQEDMVAEQPLTFCRKGCGNNFHIECMKVFGESRKQSKEHLICPLCRHDWGDLALTELKKEMDIANRAPNVHKNVGCKKCQTKPIRNDRYRCVQCKNVDLCGRCFKMNAHINHNFVVKKLVTDTWIPALRSSQARLGAVGADLADELQNRDLTTNDYDLLLQLDQRDRYPVQDYLLSVLGGQKVLAANAKSFGEPGGHAFHESCLARSILSNVYVCPHPNCDYVLFPGMQYLTVKEKTAAEVDKVSQRAALLNDADVSLSVMPLQHRSASFLRNKTADADKTTPPQGRPASQSSSAALGISTLSIGFASASHPPPILPPLIDKARTLRLRRIETRTDFWAGESKELMAMGPGPISTDERLKHAGVLRSELKKLDKDRLQKQRVQREERVRQNLSNNESNQAGVDAFFPPVSQHVSSSEKKAPQAQFQRPTLPKQVQHGKERGSRLRVGFDAHNQADGRTESLLPELFIGAIRRG